MSFPQTSPSPAPISAAEPSSAFADFVLRRLRVAELRAQLISNEIQTATAALAGGWIDGEDAIAMLGEAGLDITGASS